MMDIIFFFPSRLVEHNYCIRMASQNCHKEVLEILKQKLFEIQPEATAKSMWEYEERRFKSLNEGMYDDPN